MIFSIGEALLDCIVTASGSAEVADDISVCPGGSAFNVAATLARLGDDVCLCGRMGPDFAGRALIAEATALGVKCPDCGFRGRTPASILTVDEKGGRKSRVSKIHSSPDFSLSLPKDLSPSFVVMSSLFRPPFAEPGECLRFAKEAKAKGAVLIADVKIPKGEEMKLSDFAEFLSLLDYITPNEDEALYYTSEESPEKAAGVFKSYGIKNVIVKLGEKGCYVLPEKGEGYFVPGFKAEVVDSIGAGDAFAAGLVSALSRSELQKSAVVFACACGAASVTVRGAGAAPRNREEALSFIK